ncbi:Y-family DNA polymerase [Stappia indica]|uniref:Y-family DNA polymerase n=1 Tax=Stappia indica TaxID=538381 RepID=UPI001CD37876|nr:DNA polymerase Y family protein [Stappia indica]MCA1300638.1 DNA polymerase Y family protein [Stappia indica]
MFDGIRKRVVSMWFPRLASDRALRARPVDGPFALTLNTNNANRIYCLNAKAERQGLSCGMSYSDARIFCPELQSAPADPALDARFLHALRRWALRYCPWVGIEGRDGLVLDITGSAHLFSGEEPMLADMRQRLGRAGLSVRLGLADTRAAAWALAHHGEGSDRCEPGNPLAVLGGLPVAALRLDAGTETALQRLGLRTIETLEAANRASLARRFGPALLRRLDQAMGRQPEQISALIEPPHYGLRMTFPEPIGLVADVMESTARLLDRLCSRLAENEAGARILLLTLYRVDRAAQTVELRLARPLRDATRILPLFEREVGDVDAGFGIDLIRLEAVEVAALPSEQISAIATERTTRLDDLINRIGTRIGIENVQRFLPADSHIPERAFSLSPAFANDPKGGWASPRPRPIHLFSPEPITGSGSLPPDRFRWRRMPFTTAHAAGPERIAPEWWLEDDNWRTGLRDYWKVSTRQGRRLWLFHTPQHPGWFVQGEFP